jgi:hypothetical protein
VFARPPWGGSCDGGREDTLTIAAWLDFHLWSWRTRFPIKDNTHKLTAHYILFYLLLIHAQRYEVKAEEADSYSRLTLTAHRKNLNIQKRSKKQASSPNPDTISFLSKKPTASTITF